MKPPLPLRTISSNQIQPISTGVLDENDEMRQISSDHLISEHLLRRSGTSYPNVRISGLLDGVYYVPLSCRLSCRISKKGRSSCIEPEFHCLVRIHKRVSGSTRARQAINFPVDTGAFALHVSVDDRSPNFTVSASASPANAATCTQAWNQSP